MLGLAVSSVLVWVLKLCLLDFDGFGFGFDIRQNFVGFEFW